MSSIIWSIKQRMPQEDKVKENRLRRIAERRGFSLEKSRRRDPKAPDFGRFRLLDVRENKTVLGGEPLPFSATLDDIEHWLGERPKTRREEFEHMRDPHRPRSGIHDVLSDGEFIDRFGDFLSPSEIVAILDRKCGQETLGGIYKILHARFGEP
jgi:hypothetical protein